MRNKHVYGESQPAHWIWEVVGMMLALVLFVVVFSWIVENVA